MRSHNNHSPLKLMKATLWGSSNFSRNSENFTIAFLYSAEKIVFSASLRQVHRLNIQNAASLRHSLKCGLLDDNL